jgi:hypothetical protein
MVYFSTASVRPQSSGFDGIRVELGRRVREEFASLQARDNLPTLLGVTIWERNVRGAALSLQGSAAPVVHYGSRLADSVRFTDVVCEYLDEIGVGSGHDASNAWLTYIDVNLRHEDRHPSEFEPLIGLHRKVMPS